MGIFGDKLRQSFGFPTEKESLDHKIDNYKLRERQQLDSSMASRNISISYFEEQVRQLEKVINDNQVFIDAYESIKSKAQEKIKKGNSKVKGIIRVAGEVISGNYATLEAYFNSLLRRGIGVDEIKEYTEALALELDKMWPIYGDIIIKEKGLDPYSDDECFEIYRAYSQVLMFMQSGLLRDANRNSVIIRAQYMDLIIKAYNYSRVSNSLLRQALQRLQVNLETLKNEQLGDQFALRMIEDTQKMLQSTPEYFRAKKSQEFLDEIAKLSK